MDKSPRNLQIINFNSDSQAVLISKQIIISNFMKIIHKEQTDRVRNSKDCIAIEYPLGDVDINGAIIELAGREPDAGRVMNTECKELAYIINGSDRIVIDERVIDLKQGDLILIEPGEKFFWEGNLTMFIPCVPAWRPDQHKKVE